MMCFECKREGTDRAAVGICHNCSIGLCAEHGVRVKSLVGHATGKSFVPDVSDRELRQEAARFLCPSCAGAEEHHALDKLAA